MRIAWNVRRAGWPPRRRAGAGTASRTMSASSSVVAIGRWATMARAMRTGVALVAVGAQQAHQLGLGGPVHEVGGGDRPGRVHAHVERAGAAVAEAPLGSVELRRADAEVEQSAAGAVVAEAGKDLGHDAGDLVEPGPAHGDAVAEARQAGGGGVDGVGVLVEAEDRQVRVGVQQRLRVAAAPERGVDDDARGHGREQLDHEVDQHRAVREGGCGPAHRATSASAGMSPRNGLGVWRAESERGPSAGGLPANGPAPGWWTDDRGIFPRIWSPWRPDPQGKSCGLRRRGRSVTASGPSRPGGGPRRAPRGWRPCAGPSGRATTPPRGGGRRRP